MGIVCCAISRLVSHFMYYGEKIAACCACASMISCIMITIVVTLALGIGLGYNYCYVDLKTRHRYQPGVFRHAPELGPNFQSTRTTFTTFRPTYSRPRYGYPGEKRVTRFPGDKGWYQNVVFHKSTTSADEAIHLSDLPPHMRPNLKPRKRADIMQDNDTMDFDIEAKLPNLTNNVILAINDTVVNRTTGATDNEEILDDYIVITSDKTTNIPNSPSRNKTMPRFLKFITPSTIKMLNGD